MCLKATFHKVLVTQTDCAEAVTGHGLDNTVHHFLLVIGCELLDGSIIVVDVLAPSYKHLKTNDQTCNIISVMKWITMEY